SINAYNFIDGIDGLAAGSAFIACAFLSVIAWALGHALLGLLFLAVGASCLGFLQFNFPPSRLFMGDGGSTFLGYFFAYAAITGNRLTPELPVFIPILVLSSLYVDAALTLVNRILQRKKILEAHHTHYYQRLLSLGLNHKQVTLLEYALIVLLGTSAVVYFRAGQYFPLFLSLCWFALFTGVILKIRGLERGDRLFWERRTVFVIGVDALLIAAAYVGAYFLRMNFRFTEAEGMAMLRALPIVLVIRTACFFKYGLYRGLWKYTSTADVVRVIKAVTAGSALILTAVVLLYRFVAFPRTLFVIEYFLLILLVLGARFSLRLFHEIGREAHGDQVTRYGIVGAGDYGERIGREIKSERGARAEVVCYIDDDERKIGLALKGAPINGPVARLGEICRRHRVDALVLGVRTASEAAVGAIAQAARAAGVPLETRLRRRGEIPASVVFARVGEALGRPASTITEAVARRYRSARVLVTGAGGWVGAALVAELERQGAHVCVQLDAAGEHDLFPARALDDALVYLGPIKSYEEAEELLAVARPDVVLHCVTVDAAADANVEGYLWDHAVGATEQLSRALARAAVSRVVMLSYHGTDEPSGAASNIAAAAEARLLASLEGTSVAVLRLPRVLTAGRLEGATGDWELTEPEVVVLALNVGAEASRGIFVPAWRATVTRRLLDAATAAGALLRSAAPAGEERAGPVFPAERTHASALAGVRRVSGPLYPGADVFRKVLAAAPLATTAAQREEWMRVMKGQLYHIGSAGVRAGAP
ncbi:MAG: NAD-dependent epimerase/dehydratase family protein, partial [Candidatus Krumholzibacteria bacterium]|nr:NAD-dependent epimerase/dehydratase family protein [Candidatus Krumholzibacteria bacterium]